MLAAVAVGCVDFTPDACHVVEAPVAFGHLEVAPGEPRCTRVTVDGAVLAPRGATCSLDGPACAIVLPGEALDVHGYDGVSAVVMGEEAGLDDAGACPLTCP